MEQDGRQIIDDPYMRLHGEFADEHPILVVRNIDVALSLRQCVDWLVVEVINEGDLKAGLSWLSEQYPNTHIIIAAEKLGAEVTRFYNKTAHDHGVGVVFPRFKAGDSKLRWVEREGQVLSPGDVDQLSVDDLRECSRSEDRSTFKHMLIEQGAKAVEKCIRKQLARQERLNPPQPAAPGSWKNRLVLTDKGTPQVNVFNLITVLMHDPRWKGVITYNAFAQRILVGRPAPFGGEGNRPWSDADDTWVRAWMTEHMQFSPGTKDVIEAVRVVAEKNSFHPVKDYVESIVWDRKPRAKNWLIDYLDAMPELSPDCSQADMDDYDQLKLYLQLAGPMWLVSAIARIMEPPCKVDCVLILESGQGVGKSTTFKILGGDWFMDTPFDMGNKDSYHVLEGKWIVELPELDSFNKARNTTAKSFFSTDKDTYRKPYDRRPQDYARQCIFGGTTNEHEYFRDDENRRYWPVWCGKIDLQALARDRDQLWAEALQMYREGHPRWPSSEQKHLFEREQGKRLIDDPWFDKIVEWLADENRRDHGSIPFEVTMNELLVDVIGVQISKAGEHAERKRIGKVMRRIGWVKRQKSGKRVRYYYVRGSKALV